MSGKARQGCVKVVVMEVATLASGQKNVRAIAEWVVLHASEILNLLGLDEPRLPSASTFYRALRTIDVGTLETHLAQYTQALRRFQLSTRVS